MPPARRVPLSATSYLSSSRPALFDALVLSCTSVILCLRSCFWFLTSGSGTWHAGIMSTDSSRASTLASILSVFALAWDMGFSLEGLARTIGMPARSNPSNDFSHMLPVDSHTARHSPCLSAVFCANTVASFSVLGYDVSSKASPLSSMTHTAHAFTPMSIPTYLILSPPLQSKNGRMEAATIYQGSRSH